MAVPAGGRCILLNRSVAANAGDQQTVIRRRTLPNKPIGDLVIEKVRGLPKDLELLVVESRVEGFEFVDRLVREWHSGENRFDQDGEALFAARLDGMLVGLCGVNRDPYLSDVTVGRLRHLYVARGARLLGIGRRLVHTVLEQARQHFGRVRLRTDAAANFYASLGFSESSEENASHEVPV